MPRSKPDFFSRWEGLILRLTAGSLVLLVAAQMLLLMEAPRRFLSLVDRLEGESVSWQTPLIAEAPLTVSPTAPASYKFDRLRPSREIVLRLVQPPADREIYVLINGSRHDNFADGEVSLTVYDGDYLEIDATRASGPVRLVIRQLAGGLEAPGDGSVVEGAGGIIPIGKVKLKQ